MKLRFSVNTIMLLMIYYCIFIDFPSFQFYNLLKYAFLCVVGVYLLFNIRVLKRKEFLRIHLALLIFSIIILYTSWINRDVLETRNPFLSAIVFVGTLVETYLLMEITAVKGYGQRMINAFYAVTFFLAVAVDLLAIIGWQGDIKSGNQYLVGTKFDVVYLHFFVLALYMEKYFMEDFHRKLHMIAEKKITLNQITAVVLTSLTLMLTVIVDCTTGFVGLLLFAAMLIIYRRHSDALYSPVIYIMVLLLSFALSFVFKFIVRWQIVESILVDYLDRDITLSSRTKIFAAVPILLRGHYLWGYGYGTTYELGRKLGGFPNTQNALWEWIWQCGIAGTIAMLILIAVVVQYANKSHKTLKNGKSTYILILLYLFSLLASVEITINRAYLGYLAMLIPLTYPIEKDCAK